MRGLHIAALVLGLSVGMPLAAEPAPKASPQEVARKVKSLVDSEFYRPAHFPALGGDELAFEDIDQALARLGTSHTARYAPGTIDYVELADILRGPISKELKRLFPPDGQPAYEGIGIATKLIDGRRFVFRVYTSSAASAAGVQVGDEILKVDGLPFHEIDSFKGKRGKVVTMTIRRESGGEPRDIKLTPIRIRPSQSFFDAMVSSVRVFEREGLRIGYFRLWALGSNEIESTLTKLIKDGRLKEIDGLVVDLRGRWGGRFGEVPDLFISDGPEVSFTRRNGKVSYAMATYDKPVVAIVDEGTRSAQEMFAHLMRKQGARIVGKPTPGAVLAAGAYILPDDSLLVLPVAEVRIDGELLEGKGVRPDIEVEFPLPYAAGADPQFDAALDVMVQRLCDEPAHRSPDACTDSGMQAPN